MRRSLSLLALGALTALAVGSAAALSVDGGAIQAGVDQTLTCDTGVTVGGWGLEADDGTVRSVRISDIAPECAGNALFVRVYDLAGVLIGQGGVEPIDALEESVALPSWPLAADIENISVFIEGASGS
ncbi:MAG: hypothetical protein ACRDX9_04710 [Acidimicrobiia bacterium]